MLIQRIHHVSLVVSDTERALAFYRDLLGMSLVEERPALGFPGAWLEVGGQQIHLLEVPNPDPVSGRPAHGGRDRHTAFTVSDVEALADRLASAGVTVSRSKSGRPAFFCRDPDGNALEFVAA
jgi:glyoxylase I family protein